jgi:hypothetical protein
MRPTAARSCSIETRSCDAYTAGGLSPVSMGVAETQSTVPGGGRIRLVHAGQHPIGARRRGERQDGAGRPGFEPKTQLIQLLGPATTAASITLTAVRCAAVRSRGVTSVTGPRTTSPRCGSHGNDLHPTPCLADARVSNDRGGQLLTARALPWAGERARIARALAVRRELRSRRRRASAGRSGDAWSACRPKGR